MTTTSTAHPELHFLSYADPDVPHWLAARIALHRDRIGAHLQFRPGLTPRQQLSVHAWAGRALEGYLTDDGSRFDTGRADLEPTHEGRVWGPALSTEELDR